MHHLRQLLRARLVRGTMRDRRPRLRLLRRASGGELHGRVRDFPSFCPIVFSQLWTLSSPHATPAEPSLLLRLCSFRRHTPSDRKHKFRNPDPTNRANRLPTRKRHHLHLRSSPPSAPAGAAASTTCVVAARTRRTIRTATYPRATGGWRTAWRTAHGALAPPIIITAAPAPSHARIASRSSRKADVACLCICAPRPHRSSVVPGRKDCSGPDGYWGPKLIEFIFVLGAKRISLQPAPSPRQWGLYSFAG